MKTKLLNAIIMFSKWFIYAFFVHFIFFTFATAKSNSQQLSVEEIYINVEVKKATAAKVFREIESKSEFKFAYEEMDLNKRILFTFSGQHSIADILRKVGTKASLHFRRINNTIDVAKATKIHSDKIEEILLESIITGKVTDETGEPLTGVNIVVKGTSIGTATDINGNYRLAVPDNYNVLAFSFIGFQTQEISIGDRSVIDVQMNMDATALDEMIVIGYESVARGDLTGAVSQVRSEEFERVPAVNPLMALQGRAPGLTITQNSGEPGASASVRIRGDQSISGTNAPIYVVDGSITASIDNLNPQDIETISVLKDASAVAIYGSRAANGVIVVTTKRGTGTKEPVISLHSYGGIQKPGNLDVELLNADEWVTIFREAYENAGITPPFTDADLEMYEGIDTDWLDVIRQTGYLSNVDLSVAGGSEKSNYYVSTGYINNQGMVKETGYRRYNLRLNTDHQIRDWIKFGNSLNVFTSNTDMNVGQYQTALMKVPLTRVFEDDGGWGIIRNTNLEHQFANPLWMAQNTVQDREQKGLIGNLYLTLSLLDNLEFTTRGNATWTNDYRSSFTPGADPAWQWEDSPINSLRKDNRETLHWVTDFLLNYKQSFGDHQVTALLGYSLEEQTFERLWSSGAGTPTNEIRFLDAADPTSIRSGNSFSDWAFESQFGRLGYNFQDKYILGATVRRDGTSRLHADHRYGVFPSVSAAWRMSEESFMEDIGWLDDFKLRASWGTVGNVMSISTYGTKTSLTNWNYARNEQVAQGYTLASAVNTSLVWESTEKKNIGFDLELFDNRFYAIADFFIEDTYDLLFRQPIPRSTGLSGRPYINAGQIQNRGVELDLGYRYVSGDWNYSVGVNLTRLSNEVIDLEGRDLTTSGIVEGQPLRSFYGYKSRGIIRTQEDLDNNPHLAGKGVGDIWLEDINDDGVVNSKDRTILASRYPDLTYGLMGTVGYKNFTMQVQFQGVSGITRDIRVGGNLGTLHYFTQFPKNHDRLVLDRFHPTRNPGGEFPQVSIADTGNNISTMSDFWLYDASYLRLANLNIHYNFPATFSERIGIGQLGAYASVQNLYTFTDFYGPEVDTNSDVLTGVPQPRTWTLGVKVSF